MAQVKLNPITPDFDDILLALQNNLNTRDSWVDLLTAGVGETLTEFIASVGAFNQLAIERSLQETMLDTALLPSSIYRIARMLGVHILRKRPAEVQVNITRPISEIVSFFSIPAWTQFKVNGIDFFNRKPISFNIGNAVVTNAVLTQGLIVEEPFVSSGGIYQHFILGSPDFTISDIDLRAIIGPDNNVWSKTTDGLWHLNSEQMVFYENTLPNGQVEVQFGNNIYGASPNLNDVITFQYAITNGSDSNTSQTNLQASVSDYPNLSISTVTPIVEGDDERDPSFYKILGSSIYSSKLRAVTRADHRAIACEYPGVIDALFQGQAEINPGDLRFMNLIFVWLLTDSTWSNATWTQFQTYMYEKRSIATTVLVRKNPVAVPIVLDVKIYCFNRANLSDTATQAKAALQEYFTPKLGTLGKSMWLSDLTDILLNLEDEQGRLIDVVEINHPTTDALIKPTQYLIASSINVDADYSTTIRRNIDSGV